MADNNNGKPVNVNLFGPRANELPDNAVTGAIFQLCEGQQFTIDGKGGLSRFVTDPKTGRRTFRAEITNEYLPVETFDGKVVAWRVFKAQLVVTLVSPEEQVRMDVMDEEIIRKNANLKTPKKTRAQLRRERAVRTDTKQYNLAVAEQANTGENPFQDFDYFGAKADVNLEDAPAARARRLEKILNTPKDIGAGLSVSPSQCKAFITHMVDLKQSTEANLAELPPDMVSTMIAQYDEQIELVEKYVEMRKAAQIEAERKREEENKPKAKLIKGKDQAVQMVEVPAAN